MMMLIKLCADIYVVNHVNTLPTYLWYLPTCISNLLINYVGNVRRKSYPNIMCAHRCYCGYYFFIFLMTALLLIHNVSGGAHTHILVLPIHTLRLVMHILGLQWTMVRACNEHFELSMSLPLDQKISPRLKQKKTIQRGQRLRNGNTKKE
jgi:hypothetical protein